VSKRFLCVKINYSFREFAIRNMNHSAWGISISLPVSLRVLSGETRRLELFGLKSPSACRPSFLHGACIPKNMGHKHLALLVARI
jgi:hypothetical protein